MSEENEAQPNEFVAPVKKRSSLWITILIFLIILIIGLFIGYQSGLGDRRQAASLILDQQLEEQFQMGVKAMDSGLYQVALKNFQFVIQQDPNYPGAQDKLVDVLLKLSLSPTTTAGITPMFTATPDLRGIDAIYTQARASIAAQDWSVALENLDALRKADATYKTVEVDGMYYIALIERGRARIANLDCKVISLEGGIYDLTLAERFGPLDNLSEALRNWARLYITGASFWGIDWTQVLFYFDQVYKNMPYLMDSSCYTAMQRYRYASIAYADSLLENEAYCDASTYYQAGLLISHQDNSLVVPTANFAQAKCDKQNRPESTSVPTEGTETPTPTTDPLTTASLTGTTPASTP